MPYCTQSDIESQLPAQDLLVLTDDQGLDEIDTTVIDQAIASAESIINSYCQDRYPLPLDPVPPGILRICVDLAIYELLSRRAVDEVPKNRAKRQADAIRFLEKVAAGDIPLGSSSPAPTGGSQAGIVSGSTRLFTRSTMQGS